MYKKEEKFPGNFICTISQDIMESPVITTSTSRGLSYERASIESWLQRASRCPRSHTPLRPHQLACNHALEQAIKTLANLSEEKLNECLQNEVKTTFKELTEFKSNLDLYLAQLKKGTSRKILLLPQIEVGSGFLCPLSKRLLTDSVITPGGATYDREALKTWRRINQIDPLVRAPLGKNLLISNFDLSNGIKELLAKKVINEKTQNLISDISEFWASITNTKIINDIEKIIEINEIEKARQKRIKWLGRGVVAMTAIFAGWKFLSWCNISESSPISMELIEDNNFAVVPVDNINSALVCTMTYELMHLSTQFFQDIYVQIEQKLSHTAADTKINAVDFIENNIRMLFRDRVLARPDFYDLLDYAVQQDQSLLQKCYEIFNKQQAYVVDDKIIDYKTAFTRFIYHVVQQGDVDKVTNLINIPSLMENYALLPAAAEFGKRNILKILVERDAKIHQTDSRGNNALYYAALNGHHNSVKLLLKHQAVVTDQIFLGVINNKHLKVLRTLLKTNVDISGSYKKFVGRDVYIFKFFENILMRAADTRQPAFLLEILDYVCQREPNKDLFPLYRYVIRQGYLEMLKAFHAYNIKIKPESAIGYIWSGMTAAAESGEMEILNWMLEIYSEARGNSFQLVQECISHATFKGHVELVEMLLTKYVAVENRDFFESLSGFTQCLDSAVRQGSEPLIKLFVDLPCEFDAAQSRFQKLRYTLINVIKVEKYSIARIILASLSGEQYVEIKKIAQQSSDIQTLNFLKEHPHFSDQFKGGFFQAKSPEPESVLVMSPQPGNP